MEAKDRKADGSTPRKSNFSFASAIAKRNTGGNRGRGEPGLAPAILKTSLSPTAGGSPISSLLQTSPKHVISPIHQPSRASKEELSEGKTTRKGRDESTAKKKEEEEDLIDTLSRDNLKRLDDWTTHEKEQLML